MIRGAQPFEPYVKDLLTPQVYPDMRLFPGGPPKRPYDITGWTLSYQMGVKADRVAEAVDVATERIDVAPVPTGSVAPQPATAYAIDPRANDAFVAINRLLKGGDAIYRARTETSVGGAMWPAGTFLVAPAAGTAARLNQIATSLGLRIGAVDATPSNTLRVELSDVWKVKTPRVGRLPRLGRQHGRGVDALAARAVRVPLCERVRPRRPRGQPAARGSTSSCCPTPRITRCSTAWRRAPCPTATPAA